MQEIYPAETRSALEVFQIYEGQGNFFDIRDPSYIQREELSHQGRKKKSFFSSLMLSRQHNFLLVSSIILIDERRNKT